MKKPNQNMEGVPWKQHPESDRVLNDAIAIAREVVRLEAKSKLKKAVLHTLVWNVTASEGKYKNDTRYYSMAALKEGTQRIHEHVFERAYLVKRILEKQDRLSDYFKHAVSCVVTVDEDTALTEKGKGRIGWDRYTAAGIDVLDRKTGKLADLEKLQRSAISDFGS
jgi:hypothetical protein